LFQGSKGSPVEYDGSLDAVALDDFDELIVCSLFLQGSKGPPVEYDDSCDEIDPLIDSVFIFLLQGSKGYPVEYDGSRDAFDLLAFVVEVRAGKGRAATLPNLDEDEEEAKVEL